MTHYFSFPLDNSLQATIDNLLVEHTQGKYVAPAVSTQMAIGTTDGVIKALALDVIDIDRKSTRLNSSHIQKSRMPSSA